MSQKPIIGSGKGKGKEPSETHGKAKKNVLEGRAHESYIEK
ncbi:hypothetical protein [Desulfosporosinus sp.]|nr:hypothetical protein [Desulfosporosinus sp.]